MAVGQEVVARRNLVPRNFRAVVREAGSSLGRAHEASLILRQVAAVLSPYVVTVRVILSDATGRLREVAVEGEAGEVGRKRADRRREVFRTREPVLLPLRARPGQALAILPLVTSAQTIALVEAEAAHFVLKERWPALQAAVSAVAGQIKRVRDLTDLKAYVDATTAAHIAGELMRAGNPRTAVRVVLDFYFDWFNVPTGAWLIEQTGSDASLVGLRGVGTRRGASVRSQLSTIPRWDSLAPERRRSLVAKFASLAGLSEVAVLPVGMALFVIGGPSELWRQSLDIVSILLEDAFDHLATVSWAERRLQSLDLGIALTAHEIRGPLVGARAAIQRSMTLTGEPARELLDRSSKELDYAYELAENLLEWSVGNAPVHRRIVDLVTVAAAAVESCRLEVGPDRIVLEEPPYPIPVLVDPRHIRIAVTNLVKNAIYYTPPETPVRITMQRDGDTAVVTVEDLGPGVPAEETETIFDPFVRGKAGRQRNGSGLGLFIARRVLEAQGGWLTVDSQVPGATFRLRLPVAETG